MDLNNSAIEFSRRDIINNIKLPSKFTPELAEILGIILGDGHLDYNKKYKTTTMYCISISGSSSEDTMFYTDKINPLFYELFNKKFNISIQRNDELIVRLHSKAIATFIKNLGVMPGRKVDNNVIPNLIFSSNHQIKAGFIRGVFDTEGSVAFKKNTKGFHVAPTITLSMKSKKFIEQLKELLMEFNFTPKVYFEKYKNSRNDNNYERYRLELPGKKNLTKFLTTINFRNPRHLTKIDIWNRFGFYPPRLNYQQRLDILNGKLDPQSFYK